MKTESFILIRIPLPVLTTVNTEQGVVVMKYEKIYTLPGMSAF